MSCNRCRWCWISNDFPDLSLKVRFACWRVRKGWKSERINIPPGRKADDRLARVASMSLMWPSTSARIITSKSSFRISSREMSIQLKSADGQLFFACWSIWGEKSIPTILEAPAASANWQKCPVPHPASNTAFPLRSGRNFCTVSLERFFMGLDSAV